MILIPKALAFSLSMILISQLTLAEVYKWVDDKGQTHYSDRPRGTTHGPINTSPEPAAPSKRDRQNEQERHKRDKLLDSYDEEREINKQKQQQQQHHDAETQRKCKKVYQAIRTYETTPIIYDTDDKGERRILTAEERQRDLHRLREQYSKHCEKFEQ